MIWFERLYLATLPIGLIRVAIMSFATRGAVWLTSLLVSALLLGLPLLLALGVSRKRSGIAKWVLTAFLFIWLAAILASILSRGARSLSPEALIVVAMQAGALGLLFTASARKWLAIPTEKKPSLPALRETFE
jgi:hypothetical protein